MAKAYEYKYFVLHTVNGMRTMTGTNAEEPMRWCEQEYGDCSGVIYTDVAWKLTTGELS